MERTQWARAQELFHKLVELDPSVRLPALEQACADDQELLAQLAHRSNRPLLLSLAVPTRGRLPRRHLVWHDSILVSKVWSLQPTQGDSLRPPAPALPDDLDPLWWTRGFGCQGLKVAANSAGVR